MYIGIKRNNNTQWLACTVSGWNETTRGVWRMSKYIAMLTALLTIRKRDKFIVYYILSARSVWLLLVLFCCCFVFFFCHLFLSCVTVRKCFVWIWHFVIETRNENTSVVYAIISFFIFHFKKKKKLLFRSFVISTEKKQLIFLLLFWVLTHCYCFCLLYSYFCVVFFVVRLLCVYKIESKMN